MIFDEGNEASAFLASQSPLENRQQHCFQANSNQTVFIQ